MILSIKMTIMSCVAIVTDTALILIIMLGRVLEWFAVLQQIVSKLRRVFLCRICMYLLCLSFLWYSPSISNMHNRLLLTNYCSTFPIRLPQRYPVLHCTVYRLSELQLCLNYVVKMTGSSDRESSNLLKPGLISGS